MEFFILLHQYNDWGLLALRVAVGTIFLVHGKMKWAMWKIPPSDQMPAGMLSIMRLLSVAEPLGGSAVILGFLTSYAAIGLGIVMLGAIKFKIIKWGVPFMASDKTGWEFDFLILAAVIVLLLSGAGNISLDRYFWNL